jgi:hypothetical protein
MAKTKSDKKTTKKVLEEEEPISQPTDAEIDFDVSASELDPDATADAGEDAADADIDPDVDANANAADVDADAEPDGADGDEEDKAEVDQTPVPPKAKITWPTIVLILLNWAAAPTFLIFAYMDHAVRLQYGYRTLINHTQIWGLPLRGEMQGDKVIGGEEEFPSVSNETRPVMRLTPGQLMTVVKSRTKGDWQPGPKDAFEPVEEPTPIWLRPSDMTEEFLVDIYGKDVPQKERYPTLEAAIDHLREKLPADIARAAGDVKDAFAKKTDDEKRAFVQKSIFIMTWDSAEAKKMEDQIANAAGKDLDDMVKRALVQKILFPIALDYSDLKDGRRIWLVDRIDEELAKAKGPELDALVDDAVQRRIYYDILAPINLFRPGDLKVTDVERIADRDKVKMDKVQELLDKRLAAAVAAKYDLAYHIGAEAWGNPQERDSVEKRQKIAFILFTLAHVQVPVLDKKLYAKGIERAQTVSGLYEFTNASIAYVPAQRILEQRMAARVIAAREGNTFGAPGKEMRTSGIIDEQAAQIDRMLRQVEHVDAAQKRLDELKVQRDHFKKIYDQRVAQRKDVADKLIKARQGTEKYAKELRALQVQLHEALLELSDAADTNFRLEAEIRALELSYFKTPAKKGGKK